MQKSCFVKMTFVVDATSRRGAEEPRYIVNTKKQSELISNFQFSLNSYFSSSKLSRSLNFGFKKSRKYLNSFDKTVKSVFPEMSFFKENPNVTIGDLLNMSSGLNWNEKYFNPFNITARSYMTKDLYNLTLNLDFNSLLKVLSIGLNHLSVSVFCNFSLLVNSIFKSKNMEKRSTNSCLFSCSLP